PRSCGQDPDFGPCGPRPAVLDAVAGHGVASIGDSHPRWIEAVAAAAHRRRGGNELANYLALLAAELPPRVDRVALAPTDAEALATTLRLARAASGRPGVLTFGGAFRHPDADLREADVPLCVEHDALDYGACDEPVAGAIAAIASRPDLDDVGAVLVEPVLRSAGNLLPRRGFAAALQDLCRERGWLLILDESGTGFGRTGETFACEAFGVEPDVVVLGNGLGGGFPASAVCAGSSLWEACALPDPPAVGGGKWDGPLACAAGGAALEIVTEPGFLGQVRSVGAHAARRLRELADASLRIARPRGIGLALGFDLVEPESGGVAGWTECEAVFRACRNRGVLIAVTTSRVGLTPPLAISREEVDRLFDVIAEVVR
ncbi:MAG TPA: aminotransferase class III-fold pyridoxal phosphate-dependent enzyme, partial [Solirubrobacterales bacterium]|nr:aminotransferase class III-fold pyridoxal phosphate-dependent enzyme [Solirubrobacterales bacterium]